MRESGVTSSQNQPSRLRIVAPWIVGGAASVLALFYAIRLARDPSEAVSWFGFACFAIAAAGSIYTIVAERRSRR